MTYGIWFEWERKKPEVVDRLTFLVDEAIDILSPFFGLDIYDDEVWDRIDLPIVNVRRDPAYYDNVIYLPSEINRGDPSIGHEIAHWFLEVLNPNFKTLVRNHPIVNNYLEPIADRCGLIYHNKI